MSRKTRIILALCVIFAGIALAAAAFWFSMRWLFYENPRLIVREVQLECTSGFWAGKTEQERSVKARDFAKRVGIVPGETNLFSVNLRNLRESILRDQPEIEHVSVWRELPDLLVFRIQNRVPRADTGFGYLLDDEGIALRAGYYAQDGRVFSADGSVGSGDPKRSVDLPLVYSENLRRELASEGKTTEPEIMDALSFIRMVVTSEDFRISRITIRKVIIVRSSDSKYLQCELVYGDRQDLFRVLLPAGVSGDRPRRVAERLIPVLDDALRSPSPPRMIDLRFDGAAVVPR